MTTKDESAATVQPGGALLTPYEHGRKRGIVRPSKTVVNGNRGEYRTPEFRAAESLHGWSAHEKHTATPLTITSDAFDAAIKAAGNADVQGNYAPHYAALAPYLRGYK